MQTSANVVIIGAGVIGCSTAYHLAQMGIDEVVVLEKDQIGGGSSGKSASMLSLQFCHDELSARLAKASYDRFMDFEEELGVAIDFKPIGWVSLATEETADLLRNTARTAQTLGIETEVLTPDEIRYRYPEVHTDDLALGTWGPDDGPFDPHMIMWGYVQNARRMGVVVEEGVAATDIRVRGGRVEAVETNAGTIATPVVVNAAGPWAVEIGRWVDVEIPVINSARTIVVTGPFPEIPSDRPFMEDVTVEWYFRPEGPGVLMGMGSLPTEETEVQFNFDMLEEIIETAAHRVPVLEKASVLTAWTGVRPMTLDDRPILGPVDGIEGMILSCGWGGTGIIQAPMAGQLVAEIIAQGTASTMDTAPFRLGRFDGQSVATVADMRVAARLGPSHQRGSL